MRLRALKWLLIGAGCLVGAVVGLYLATDGDYSVPALVTEDPSLSSQTIAGVDLHVKVVHGPPNAQTIIVLHGGPGADFRSLLGFAELSDRNTVLFYDQRGAGLSERVGAEHLMMDGYLAELDGLIDRNSPNQPVILIGHSWGAMLAAAYLGHQPQRVDRAVLIEPGYLNAEGRTEWERRAAEFTTGPAYWTAALLHGFRAAHVSGPDPWASGDFLVGQMVSVFANNPENPYHCGNGYTAPGWRFGALASSVWQQAPAKDVDLISRGFAFDGPILLVAGECDDWIGEPLQKAHAAQFKNATLRVIPQAGHNVIWDNPSATLDAVRGFLAVNR